MRRAVKAGVWRVRRVPFCEPRLPLDDICGAFAKAKPGQRKSSIGGKVLIYIVSRHTRSPRVIKAEARGMRRSNVAHALARGPEYRFVQGGRPFTSPFFRMYLRPCADGRHGTLRRVSQCSCNDV